MASYGSGALQPGQLRGADMQAPQHPGARIAAGGHAPCLREVPPAAYGCAGNAQRGESFTPCSATPSRGDRVAELESALEAASAFAKGKL